MDKINSAPRLCSWVVVMVMVVAKKASTSRIITRHLPQHIQKNIFTCISIVCKEYSDFVKLIILFHYTQKVRSVGGYLKAQDYLGNFF
ncbi:hypothetical protein BDFB_011251 [Asbolus verrucosus]|uniref:Uncharacterized protein n=1 Tax=Asbolus verrucosus TaxID=1661398 RepID=A0A482VKX1_ASBVE|nr:hypothetical protein BDFB_011251 [Asbolus verrucosus]